MDMGIADDFQGKFKRATIQQGGAGTLAASSYLCPGVASHFMLARAAEMRKLKTDWLGLHNYNDLWWCGATNRIKRNHLRIRQSLRLAQARHEEQGGGRRPKP